MSIVQKAFEKAMELRADPFAIKRPLAETPEYLTPLFRKNYLLREKLTTQKVIGQGQVLLLSL
jgi:hypothetical protein